MSAEEAAERFVPVLTDALRRCALHLTGEAARNLDDVRGTHDDQWAIFEGYGEGTMRLLAGLDFRSDQEAFISLKLSKGKR